MHVYTIHTYIESILVSVVRNENGQHTRVSSDSSNNNNIVVRKTKNKVEYKIKESHLNVCVRAYNEIG